MAFVVATQDRGADAGLVFVRWGSLARQRQRRPLSSAARDGRAASAAVSTAARGRVCGWEKVREPPVVPGRLEVRRGACAGASSLRRALGAWESGAAAEGSGVAEVSTAEGSGGRSTGAGLGGRPGQRGERPRVGGRPEKRA